MKALKCIAAACLLVSSIAQAVEIPIPLVGCVVGGTRRGSKQDLPPITALKQQLDGSWIAEIYGGLSTPGGQTINFRDFQVDFKGTKSMADVRPGRHGILFSTAKDSFGRDVVPGGFFDIDGNCSILPEYLFELGLMYLDGTPANDSLPIRVTIKKL